jgi:hypothetical protein
MLERSGTVIGPGKKGVKNPKFLFMLVRWTRINTIPSANEKHNIFIT